jgi:hypothetical protein
MITAHVRNIFLYFFTDIRIVEDLIACGPVLW